MSSRNSKASVRTSEQAVISGLRTLLPKRIIPLAGEMVKSGDLEKQLAEHVATLAAIDEAQAKRLALIADAREQRKALRPLLAGLRHYVAGVFGESSAELRSFGFTPRVVAVKSIETKALAVAKLRATRAARHTKGKRQKMSIHGTIEVGEAPSPQPSPPEPSPPRPVAPNGAPVNGANAH